MIASYFTRDGFEVSTATDGGQALELARAVDPDIVILDLGLPVLGGIEVCRALRTFSDCYVIMLTARADELDMLIGLGVGADDYVTKPFSARELMARVNVMLRRPRTSRRPPAPHHIEPRRFGALSIDIESREAFVGDEPVPLTRTEFDVLAALSAHPRRAFSRRALIEQVWGTGWVGDEHLVDVHIGHLRRKLGDDPSAPRFVRTVRGVGYRMGDGG